MPTMAKQMRVLVIDDDPLTVRLVSSVVTRACGAVVDGFVNPLQALDGARSTAYDLMVTDLQMPEMSGTELAAQFVLLQPNIPPQAGRGSCHLSAIVSDGKSLSCGEGS
jgi:CheY-like chemotaxis protein